MVRCYLVGYGFRCDKQRPEQGSKFTGIAVEFATGMMRVHMNDPMMRPERQAAEIAVEATIISLSVQSVGVKHERNEIRNKTSEIQISILFPEKVK